MRLTTIHAIDCLFTIVAFGHTRIVLSSIPLRLQMLIHKVISKQVSSFVMSRDFCGSRN